MSVNTDFSEWATSMSGCDGGNPNGKVWFCGIEWADTVDPKKFDFAIETRKIKTEIPSFSSMDKLNPRSSFDQNMIKLLFTSTQGEVISKEKISDFKKNYKPFMKDSDFFKLNLYPVPFSNTDNKLWDKGWDNKTGFKNKNMYKLWCWQNRFSMIRKWSKDAKLILCVGKTYLNDFLIAFCGIDNIDFNSINTEIIEGLELNYVYLKPNKLVCITPFLTNAGNLVGDIKIEKFGMRINQLYKDRYQSDIL